MSTLYLHIGSPKTGTSAIQRFMAKNRRLIKRAGYCYPDFGVSFPGIWDNRNAHFLVHKIYDKNKNNLVDKENELVTKCLDKISVFTKSFENIVISDEGIWHGARKKEQFWGNLKKQLDERGIDLKIVVYLRRQDLFIQSYWAQLVKETLNLSFDEFIASERYKRYILDYYTYLNGVASVVGKDNMIVRVYEKQKSIISDFLESIHLELSDECEDTDIVNNISLSGICLEVKRMLNNMPEYKKKFNFIVPYLINVQAEMNQNLGFQKSRYFSYDDQVKFLAQYEEGNSAIAREYLKREDGILFRDSIVADDSTKISSYTTEELIAVCGKVMALQQQKIDELKTVKFYLKETEKKLKNVKENVFFKIAKKVKRALVTQLKK